ncbi:hypothetical protein TIFTF001_040433 [Ficus carica]|uniref:Epoxide hydrolase n=1 Tax=Ficus carica TaxID=3494 RepID=A0AA88CMB7_FICCA|nr:hypothetical protein TIFTF001_040433 [Ficus carica]
MTPKSFVEIFRTALPDKVKALVNLGVAFMPRNPVIKFVDGFRAFFGDDFYICRFQNGDVGGRRDRKRFRFRGHCNGTQETLYIIRSNSSSLLIPKDEGFKAIKVPDTLPSWLSEEYIQYCASKFDQKGFTGELNYYRAFDITWELIAPWTGTQIKVPTKFIVGDEDSTYHSPGVKQYVESGGFKKVVPALQEVVIIEEAAHFINQAKPEEISAHIYDFIKKF